MKTGLKPVLWSGAAFLLLVLTVVPGLSVLALLLMMIPYVILYATLPRGSFVLHVLAAWVLAVVVVGPVVLIIGLFFLLPAIVMGHLYTKSVPAAKVIRTVTLVMLAQLMLQLLVFEVVMNLSLIDEIGDMIRLTVDNMLAQNPLAASVTPEIVDQMIRTIINMIPLTFILLSFIYTVLTHYIARRVVSNEGLEVPAFAQAKDWKLPRVLVFYYLIAYAIDMFMLRNSDSFMAIALMNLVPLLSYVFAIQAIGFFFFIAHQRGWSKAVPIIIAIPVLLFPPLSLIGVLDTAFPIRKSLTKQQ